jgi:condensin-2 complex subunit H2
MNALNTCCHCRDLALNWNVDIAQDLENYLTDLEMVHISFDGGETTMNFAEAALLIQGSVAIISKA